MLNLSNIFLATFTSAFCHLRYILGFALICLLIPKKSDLFFINYLLQLNFSLFLFPGSLSGQPVTRLELLRLRLLLSVAGQLTNTLAGSQHRHTEQLHLLGRDLREWVHHQRSLSLVQQWSGSGVNVSAGPWREEILARLAEQGRSSSVSVSVSAVLVPADLSIS